MDNDTLGIPCAFCGGETVLDQVDANHRYFVLCLDCNAAGPDSESADMAVNLYAPVAQVMEWCRSVPHETYETFANAGAQATGKPI